MKKTGVLVLLFGALSWAAPARAVGGANRPAVVFGELVANAPAAEHARWTTMLASFGSKGPLPPVEALLTNLAKTVGASSLDGVDAKRPIALVLLDPRAFSKSPVLLVAEVASEKTFAASLAATPEVAIKRQKRAVVLGAADALAAAGDYALSRLRGAPADGLRARLFVEPVWAAFGAQAQGLKALLVAQAGTPGSPMPAASMGKMFDWLIAGIEESSELGIELGARNGGIDAVLSLLVRAGTPMDTFAAQQTPADFSLLSRVADQPYSFLAGGRMNLTNAGNGLVELLFGGAKGDPKAAAQLQDWLRLASGELAMMGAFSTPQKIEYQYLLRSPEASKMASAFPAMIDAMNQNGMLDGMAKISRVPKANASYDGLTLAQSELRYDFSKMPTVVGDKKFSLASVWTSWDDVVAMATGGDALARIRKLVDAARHGKGTWQPTASIRASLDRARAAKESVWVRMDLSAMAASAAASTGKPAQVPPGIAPTIGFGCSPHTIWMRMSVPSPPQTAGSL